MSKLPQSRSQAKLRGFSARAYDSLFNSGAGKAKKKRDVCGSGADVEQVVEKVENLWQREDLHKPIPDQRESSTEGSTTASIDGAAAISVDCSARGGASGRRDSELSSSVVPKNIREIAKELITKEDLMCHFSEIIEDCAASVIDEKLAEEDPNALTSLELSKAVERGEHRFAHLCELPLKIILTPLSRGGRMVSRFANLLEMQFGPLHAALQVGNVILEWNDSSLVIPHMCNFEEQLLQSDVQGVSGWADFTRSQYDDVRKALTKADYQQQIELVYNFTAEKHRQIEALVDVIIRYNRTYYYNLFDRNCQHFVADALKALGVEKPTQFTGGLREYFVELKKGRSSAVAAKFPNHGELDKFVKGKEENGEINKMEQNDLEFLLAQCFRFHLEQKSQLQDQNVDLANWVCEEATCCMQRLERLIRFEALRIHNFKTVNVNC